MWKFQQSPNYHPGRLAHVSRIGIHSTESPGNSAQSVANFLCQASTKASAHFVSGSDAVIQLVRTTDTAWAMPNVNADGIHIELCGYAAWSKNDWLDGQGKLSLVHGSCVAAELVSAIRFFKGQMDVRWLTDDEVRNHRGFGLIEHRTASRVLGPVGGHTDPGANFPVDEFLDMVNWWLPHITTWDFAA